jgi:hypothetical protein
MLRLPYKHLYKDPLDDHNREAAEKHETQKQKPFQRRLEGETLPESRPVASPPSRCQHYHHRHEEGVVHLWTMGLW